jgi:hypothetical protein
MENNEIKFINGLKLKLKLFTFLYLGFALQYNGWNI